MTALGHLANRLQFKRVCVSFSSYLGTLIECLLRYQVTLTLGPCNLNACQVGGEYEGIFQ